MGGEEILVSECDFGDTQGDSRVFFGDVQARGGHIKRRELHRLAPDAVTSITSDNAALNAITVDITDLAWSGVQPGASARFDLGGDIVLEAYDVNVVSSESTTCKIGFFLEPTGAWDVVVENPDGAEARLEEGFTVASTCGEGGGMAVMMLGISLGLLSLAGGIRSRRSRSNRKSV
ncbi:MAG: hypothetical protein SWK76_04365 [Actinomycetota bacterium]|nr:hypothetical protein [Actinomycetota bacterium]